MPKAHPADAREFWRRVFVVVRAGLRYGEGAPWPKGSVLTLDFTLARQEFLALNGGPQFSFTPAISVS